MLNDNRNFRSLFSELLKKGKRENVSYAVTQFENSVAQVLFVTKTTAG